MHCARFARHYTKWWLLLMQDILWCLDCMQNSRNFCERERRTIFERKVWSEWKNGEGEWWVRLARFTLEDLACGASRLPKTTVLQSKLIAANCGLLINDLLLEKLNVIMHWVLINKYINWYAICKITNLRSIVPLKYDYSFKRFRFPLGRARGSFLEAPGNYRAR